MVEAAGYSGTPLPRKLGIVPGSRVLLVGAPPEFGLGPLPDVDVHRRAGRSPYDVVLVFAPDRRALAARFDRARRRLTTAGGLWVAWPKKASGVPTDITEDTVREIALPTGLVDVKVCAVDETWSGLRLCWRKELRAEKRAGG